MESRLSRITSCLAAPKFSVIPGSRSAGGAGSAIHGKAQATSLHVAVEQIVLLDGLHDKLILDFSHDQYNLVNHEV